jgi:hypothetical protein
VRAENGPEKELAMLEEISNNSLGKLAPMAGVVVHNTGRIYFYRGRTLTADVFYAMRQPFYRAEIHCVLIPGEFRSIIISIVPAETWYR